MTHSVIAFRRAGAWTALFVALSAAGCASLNTLNHCSRAPMHAGCPACGAASGMACGCRPDARSGGYKPTHWAHSEAAPKAGRSLVQSTRRDTANKSSPAFAKEPAQSNAQGKVELTGWQGELPPELAPAPEVVLGGPEPVAAMFHGCPTCAHCGQHGPLGDGNWLKRHHCGGPACCRPHFPRMAQLRRFFHDHLFGCGGAACDSCRNDCAPIPGVPLPGSPNYGLEVAKRMPTGRVTMAPFHAVCPPPPYLLDRLAAALWTRPLLSRLHCLLPHHRTGLCGQACYAPMPTQWQNAPPALEVEPSPVAPPAAPPAEEPPPAPEQPAPQQEQAPPAPPSEGEAAPAPPPGLELPMPQAEPEAPAAVPESPMPAPPAAEPARPAPEEIPDLFPQRGEPQHKHESVARRNAEDEWRSANPQPQARPLEPQASPEGPRLSPIRPADDFGAVERESSSRKSTLRFADDATPGAVTPVGHEAPLAR